MVLDMVSRKAVNLHLLLTLDTYGRTYVVVSRQSISRYANSSIHSKALDILVALHLEVNARPPPFVDHAGILRESKILCYRWTLDIRWMNPDTKATIPSCVSACYTPKFVRRIDDITGLLVPG